MHWEGNALKLYIINVFPIMVSLFPLDFKIFVDLLTGDLLTGDLLNCSPFDLGTF